YVASSEEIGFIESQQGFTSIAFEPDGHQLLAAEGNGSVTLLDLQELPAPDGGAAQPLELSSSRSFAHLPGAALELHYSPDGRQVAMLVPDTGILIYDAQSGEQLLEISGVSDAADTFAYSAAGETIAARSADLEVTVWDANTGDTLLIIPVDELVTNVAFSPDGRYLAIGTADGKATLWDIQSSAAAVFLAGHAGRVTDMVFHPDGRLLATSAADGLTRVWDLDLAGRERFTLAAHEGRAHDVQYNADGTLLASAGDDGLVNLWAAQSGDLLHELPGPFNRVHFPTFSPDGLRLAAANRDEGLAIWDAHTGQELLSLQSEAPVTAIDYNSEGTIIAAGDQEGKITIWDASTGERLLVISTNSPEIVELIFITPAVIYAWDRTGLLMAWNVQTGDLLSELQCINDVHIDADLSEDGQYIAAACNWVFVAEAVEVPEEGDTIYRLASNDSGETVGVSFSPDGSSVAIVGSAGDISLWDTATGQVDLRLYTPQVSELGYMAYGLSYGLGSVGTSFGGIDFSPDGRYLAAAAADGTIRVFVLPFEELMANLRARLSRDFSDAECQKYLNLPECPAE
ncbi:MAG: WD40 repeat domain-containing protein, partial [Candidatus Promineifilaceae bacterium]|nr:WD40 repeat domain-containing protein [Candidatus Promineifilaceae bacterium]